MSCLTWCALASISYSGQTPYVIQLFPVSSQNQADTTRQDSLSGKVISPIDSTDSVHTHLLQPTKPASVDSFLRLEQPELADSLHRRGNLRTLSRDTGNDSLAHPLDSLIAENDSLAKKDSTWVTYLDSTARIAQFVHHRYDPPSVDLFEKDNYSLYLDVRSAAYKRDFNIDTSGQTVSVRELVNGRDVKVPTIIPLDDYVKRRLVHEQKASWVKIVKDYKFAESRDELGGLLNNLKSIEIPIPANPLFSIFGGRGIKLNVSGGVDIRAGFRNTKSDAVTTSSFDQSRNEPNFNQDVQILVDGLIGDKLKIHADWNTQRTFEYENQLRINYNGYDDEIIQSVEAGNVSLQTPSLIGGGQSLFGIKAKLQTGPLTLTTLLSQKKGESKEFTVSGGSQSRTQDILPAGYSKNYYFVDTTYRSFWETLHSALIPVIDDQIEASQITQIDVWESVTGNAGVNSGVAVQQRAFVNLPPHPIGDTYQPGFVNGLDTSSSGNYIRGYWRRLDPNKDYKVDKYGGYIVLNSIIDAQAYAVSYTILGLKDQQNLGQRLSLVYGDSVRGESQPYLKLIKPKGLNDHPEYKPAWDLMLKNIYSLGVGHVDEKDFQFSIALRGNGPEVTQIGGRNLLQVLGLDRFDRSFVQQPDNQFDFIKGLTIDVDRGDIIFPTLRPFDTGIFKYFQRNNLPTTGIDSILFSEVYDTMAYAAQQIAIKNRFVMHFKATGTTSEVSSTKSTYSLGFNAVEGSVQVYLNKILLTPNVDYTVDYIVGEVRILNPQALVPNADLQIKYEQNDLFQLASKTLIGARGDLPDFLPNTKLGFTVMDYNQATLSDKVRLGEEPIHNLILGTDVSTSFDVPFLTQVLDVLPFIRTRDVSTITIGGEAAYMIPDPNTKHSNVLSDNGASVAYMDDFEGSRRSIPLVLSYTAWHLASPPVYTLLDHTLPDSTKTFSRARLNWYNNSSCFEPVLVSEIYGDRKKVRRGEEFVTVFGLKYDPNRRGTYNYSRNMDATLYHSADSKERRKNWGGTMRYISSSVGLMEQNAEYLEVWLKASSANVDDLRRGRLYIDIGKISERVIQNNKRVNSEDVIPFPGNEPGNPTGVIHPGQDLGIDMESDDDERREHTDYLSSTNIDFLRQHGDYDPEDPAGDDWDLEQCGQDRTHVNGTEGNKVNRFGRSATVGGIPDTEDLDGSGLTESQNQYLEYEVPLNAEQYITDGAGGEILASNPYIVGHGNNDWYQLRIPLRGAARTIPPNRSQDDLLRDVQYIRLWFTGFEDSVNVKIAEMNFVGNQWVQRVRNDSILKASVVSIEDNPEYNSADYQALGIVRPTDKTQPDQIIQGNEQSLSLIIRGLLRGESREIYRSFTQRPLDLINYKSMKMFIHGDQQFNYYAPDRYDAEVFVRFGRDSSNYYEYRIPVKPGWHADNQITIDFAKLTAIKASRDSINQIFRRPANAAGATYAVKGNPSLRNVSEISIGVTNPSAQGGTSPLVGQVWVNELRLTDVDNASGFAYRLTSNVKLADLGNVQFSYAKTDPSFHPLDQRFGSQNTSTSWAVISGMSLGKYLPLEWQGTALDLGYSHSENLTKPKYLPNTDIVAQAAADQVAKSGNSASQAQADDLVTASQTLSVHDSYQVNNFRIALPIQWWLIRDTFSKLSYGFQYSVDRSHDPSTYERKNWGWSFRMNYAVSIPSEYSIQPFKNIFKGIFLLDEFKDWKLYYMPITNISASLGAQRSRAYEQTRILGTLPRDTRDFRSGKQAGFGWKLTEGGLLNLSGDYGISLDRDLRSVDNDTAGRNFSSLLKNMFFAGADNRYSQKLSVNSKPRILNMLGISKYMDLTFGYSVTYNWQNTFQANDQGKSASVDNNITLSTSLRLKALTDPLFASSDAGNSQPPPSAIPKGGGGPGSAKDSGAVQSAAADSNKRKLPDIIGALKTGARIFIKIPFLDYESISLNFTQSNRVGNQGVVGSTGFQNFWGRLPFQGSLPEYGPSRLYQLGLISDPSGHLEFASSSRFPFAQWRVIPGRRAPNLKISDQFSQNNSIALRTNRTLWEGATLDLNWKVGWQFSKSTTIETDANGIPTPSLVSTGGSVDRSFLTLPPVLFLKVFKSNLQDVGKKFDQYVAQKKPEDVAFTEAFENGMEALPFLSKVFGQFVPRPNWSLRWDGLEKIAGLRSVFTKLSLEHNYSSTFHRDFRSTATGGEQTTTERINYGFSPLASVTATFKDFLKGGLTGSLRYNTATILDLNVQGRNIIETYSQEMAISISYSRKGFKIPVFGLNLSNDVDMGITFSRTKNAKRSYDPRKLSQTQEGLPLEGNTRTLIEPRLTYTLSTRVRAALYYRYLKLAPDEGGSQIYGTTTNEAGLEIHITI